MLITGCWYDERRPEAHTTIRNIGSPVDSDHLPSAVAIQSKGEIEVE